MKRRRARSKKAGWLKLVRLPPRRVRLIAVPLVVIGIALLLVNNDVGLMIGWRDLPTVFVVIVIYFACELCFGVARSGATRARNNTPSHPEIGKAP
jgi:hypothetical protein